MTGALNIKLVEATDFFQQARSAFPIDFTRGEDVSLVQGRVWLAPISNTWREALRDEPSSNSEIMRSAVLPPVAATVGRKEATTQSAPLEIWEGTVLSVDIDGRVIHAELDAKMGIMPRHTAEIDFEWITEQDMDLVRPGAVFYLTLFKRMNPSVENAQELRFRRRPSWSKQQLQTVHAEAAALKSKLRDLPRASD